MSEQKRKQRPRAGEIELVPDAWPRFERFIGEIVKAGPQHRITTTGPESIATRAASAGVPEPVFFRFNSASARWIASAARTARSASFSCAKPVAELLAAHLRHRRRSCVQIGSY
jgi:hypothetical protein